MKPTGYIVLGGLAVAGAVIAFSKKTGAVSKYAPPPLEPAPVTPPTLLPSGLPPENPIPAGTSAVVATQTTSLSLRSAPSSTSSALAQMAKGDAVLVTGPLQNGFSPVVYQGVAGFAYSGYLRAAGAPSPAQPSSGPRLLSWPALMKPGAQYKAEIHLGSFRASLADKGAVEKELTEQGFSNVRASGSGADWMATGTWARGSESIAKPDEISRAWEV